MKKLTKKQYKRRQLLLNIELNNIQNEIEIWHIELNNGHCEDKNYLYGLEYLAKQNIKDLEDS